MDDKDPIYVPVDTKTLGYATAIGCFPKVFPALVIISIIIGIILGGMWVFQKGYELVNYGTLNETAIPTVIAERQQLLIEKLRTMGSMDINQTKEYTLSQTKFFYRVDHLEFRDEKVYVYFESDRAYQPHIEHSCLAWKASSYTWNTQEPVEQSVNWTGSSYGIGYVAFPDSVITSEENFYFSFGCLIRLVEVKDALTKGNEYDFLLWKKGFK